MGKKRLDSHEFVVLQTKLTQALQGGGIQRIEKQHEKGKLSARETNRGTGGFRLV
jgi:acetyl-CoA carboxylase carboxyltransferase component